MVSVTGYSVDFIVVQVLLMYWLAIVTVVVWGVGNRLHDKTSFLSKWRNIIGVAVLSVIAAGGITFMPVRIGDVMFINGILMGLFGFGIARVLQWRLVNG